jgi:hypothetical protein
MPVLQMGRKILEINDLISVCGKLRKYGFGRRWWNDWQ